MLQTNWKFVKYVLHNNHSMTPEQPKKKPIEQSIKIEHEKLDTEEAKSTKDAEESTVSTKLSEENSTSDTPTEDTEESKPTEIH